MKLTNVTALTMFFTYKEDTYKYRQWRTKYDERVLRLRKHYPGSPNLIHSTGNIGTFTALGKEILAILEDELKQNFCQL